MARSKGWYWPWVIAGILVAGIVPNLVLVAVALNDPSFAVVDDYYDKAKHWDQEMARRRASRALGWQIDFSVEPVEGRPGFRRMRAAVLDREGIPLEDCRVELETFHNARAAQKQQVHLEWDGATHVATLPMRKPGVWVFRFDVSRKGERFSQSARRELPAVLP